MVVGKWLGLGALVVLVDQLVKWRVVTTMAYGDERPLLPFLSWVRWHNEGAAFSMLSDAGGWQRWFFIVLAVVFVVFIVYELRRLPRDQQLMGWVYGLIIGGAIGNLIDRVLNGYVVDFVLLHWGNWYFPAFNVADAALSIGAGLWIFAMLVEHRRERRNQQHQEKS
jgi:signal peptidase II